ncbi:hypothetical protein [Protaetiibacter mangrovi]|uniref:Phage holin family protein n=1 Tax=Protaetiibacter mangrovi TaxID=2970926 RepID=A0ABT1ZF35_9MICO|nr:hypothetical protein [Protaetiibacter mangrovi]MCS0499294.1 hypothetical protein [Protaetiibacter mangrovi]TPX05171.1 hypothetical protein FJ656_07940 [Schumannella luteola]
MIVLPAITIMTLIYLVATVVALIDGIIRARGRGNTVLAVIEIVVAALMILALFVAIPFGAITLGIALLVVLILQLVLRGSVRRGGGVSLTVIALIATAVWLVLAFGWVHIPGVN